MRYLPLSVENLFEVSSSHSSHVECGSSACDVWSVGKKIRPGSRVRLRRNVGNWLYVHEHSKLCAADRKAQSFCQHSRKKSSSRQRPVTSHHLPYESRLPSRRRRHVCSFQTAFRFVSFRFASFRHTGSSVASLPQLMLQALSKNCEFVMSVCPFVWNNSTPTGRILMKFGIFIYFENLLRKFKFL